MHEWKYGEKRFLGFIPSKELLDIPADFNLDTANSVEHWLKEERSFKRRFLNYLEESKSPIVDTVLGGVMGFAAGEVFKAAGNVLIDPSAGQNMYLLFSTQRDYFNILGAIFGGTIGLSLFPSLRAIIQRKDLFRS